MNTDPHMPTNERRFKLKHLLCSLLALTSSWPLASAWFAYLDRSSTGDHLRSIRDLYGYMILTGVVYVLGWFVVGLPLALGGDRILEKPIRTIVMAGIGGVAAILIFFILLSLPAAALTLLFGRGPARFTDLPQSRVVSVFGMFFGIAFVMAAITALLYEGYLALASKFGSVSVAAGQ